MSLANIYSALQNKFIVNDLDAGILEIKDQPINPSGNTTQNLASVLSTGSTSGANNMTLTQYLTLDNSSNGNTLAQLHLNDPNGSWQESNTTGALQLQYYPTSGSSFNALTLNSDKSVVVGDQNNTTSTLYVNGKSGKAQVYDSLYNIPPSSGGGSQNLQQVLTTGNGAGNDSITDLGGLTFHTLGNTWSITQSGDGDSLIVETADNPYISIGTSSVVVGNSTSNTTLQVNGSKGLGTVYDPIYNPIPNITATSSGVVFGNSSTATQLEINGPSGTGLIYDSVYNVPPVNSGSAMTILSYITNQKQQIPSANTIVNWDAVDSANTVGTSPLTFVSDSFEYPKSSSHTSPCLVSISCSLEWGKATTSGTSRAIFIYKNSSDNDRYGMNVISVSDNYTTLSSSCSMVLQPGDNFTVMCWHDDSATQNLNDSYPSRIQIITQILTP